MDKHILVHYREDDTRAVSFLVKSTSALNQYLNKYT